MEEEKTYRYTAYDDAFHIMTHECDDILISFINGAFGENYGKEARIEHLSNESYDKEDAKTSKKTISDEHFGIFEGHRREIYHLECESGGYDKEILVRMFSYNISHSTRNANKNSPYNLIINLPRSGLLVLRDKGNPPDHVTIEIRIMKDKFRYAFPVIRMSDYSIDRIFGEKMYLLIPFYFFNLEERLKYYDRDEEDMKEFERIYTDIIQRVKREDAAKLSERSKRVIIREMGEVVKRMAHKEVNVIKKVGDIMRRTYKKPQYLVEYDAGVVEGEDRRLIIQICRKLRKNKEPQQIAEELEENEIRVTAICKAAEEFAPDYNEEDVIKSVLGEKTIV